MKAEVNVFPESGSNNPVVEVRTGEALPLREKKVILIAGNIETVANFLAKRHFQKPDDNSGEVVTTLLPDTGLQTVNPNRALIEVDISQGAMVLSLDPEDYYGAKISGKLETAEELEIFKVNTEKMYSREQLIKLIRFNRAFFPDKDHHDELLSAFQKFSVNAYVHIDKENDNRGNASSKFKQTVKSDVPLSFKLEMPIYKGQPKEIFHVDICIEVNGSSVNFYFESVELAELLQVRKEEIIAKQLESCTSFPIIYK